MANPSIGSVVASLGEAVAGPVGMAADSASLESRSRMLRGATQDNRTPHVAWLGDASQNRASIAVSGVPAALGRYYESGTPSKCRECPRQAETRTDGVDQRDQPEESR